MSYGNNIFNLNLTVLLKSATHILIALLNNRLLFGISASLFMRKPTVSQPEFYFNVPILKACNFLPPSKAFLKVSLHFDGT